MMTTDGGSHGRHGGTAHIYCHWQPEPQAASEPEPEPEPATAWATE